MVTKNKKIDIVKKERRGRPKGSKTKETRKRGRKHITIKQIEIALRQTGGFLTYAAKKLDCTYQNIRQRIDGSPHLIRVLESVHESKLDLSEHKLMQQIKDDNLSAIIFHLKCQGKKRGYVEKYQDQTEQQTEPQPVQVIIQVEDGKKNS